MNFLKSGGGCSNTGELAAAILHEFGHGLDQNTGGAADAASSEAVGDTTAILETRQSCIAANFKPGVPCHNCVSTACTGRSRPGALRPGRLRSDRAPEHRRASGGIDCGRFACGFFQLCKGPMG